MKHRHHRIHYSYFSCIQTYAVYINRGCTLQLERL